MSMKELINAAYNVDSFEFHPGVINDYDLGAICMQSGMLDLIQDLPDEVFDLLDEEKVGQALRRNEQGTFTSQGYVYCSSKDWQEVYDGVHLPEQPDRHSGLISLRLESCLLYTSSYGRKRQGDLLYSRGRRVCEDEGWQHQRLSDAGTFSVPIQYAVYRD